MLSLSVFVMDLLTTLCGWALPRHLQSFELIERIVGGGLQVAHGCTFLVVEVRLCQSFIIEF